MFHGFLVRVNTPEGANREDARKALQAVIDNGMLDAQATPEDERTELETLVANSEITIAK